METFADMWRSNVQYNSDRTACVIGTRQTTYGALFERAQKLSSAFHRLGLRKHDRVAMLAMNCHEWFEFYGANALGGTIAATVNFRLAPPEISYTVNDCTPRVLIFEEQYAGVIGGLRSALKSVEHYICIGAAPEWAQSFEALLGTGSPEGSPVAPGPDDYALLMYTSGTTGRPKGALKTQRATYALFEQNAIIMNMYGNDRLLVMMPLFHVGAASLAFSMFWAGGTTYVHRQFDPAAAMRAYAEEQITITYMAPTMVQAMMDLPNLDDFDLSTIRIFNYAAAPMPVTLLRRCTRKFGKIFLNSYGSTEAGGTVLYPHEHFLEGEGTPAQVKRLASVGRPFPATRVRIVDDQDRDVPAGMPGEILLSSPSTMSGYWNNTAATLESLRDGWYYTGDVGYLDEHGYLYLVDRKKDMIVSGGENIYCREVEEALMEHGSLVDVAVIGVPDAYWGEAVKAIAIKKPTAIVTEAELIDFCATRIARYKRPKSLDFVAELPRLPSGKVRKNILREQYRS